MRELVRGDLAGILDDGRVLQIGLPRADRLALRLRPRQTIRRDARADRGEAVELRLKIFEVECEVEKIDVAWCGLRRRTPGQADGCLLYTSPSPRD